MYHIIFDRRLQSFCTSAVTFVFSHDKFAAIPLSKEEANKLADAFNYRHNSRARFVVRRMA